jgi:Na+/H+ antiporter NhaB
MIEKSVRLFLRPRKYAETYANKLPKKAPAWYKETMVSFVVLSSLVLISLKPNSATKLGSERVVPMKALHCVSQQ